MQSIELVITFIPFYRQLLSMVYTTLIDVGKLSR